MSRVVDRRHIFHPQEKEQFLHLMRELETFCGVHVLTYCLMGNHFHILLAVPKPPAILPSADTILAQLACLTAHQDLGAARQELERIRTQGDAEAEAHWCARYYARMWDVSGFMKLLKQRFTQWYNRRSGRKGTLWEDRFKSVLVDGAGHALVTMAAYIDLNPVRAGLVADPKDYRWSGYGEAAAGRRRARTGLQLVAEALAGHRLNLLQTLEVYRMHVYGQGHEAQETQLPEGKTARGALTHEAVMEVLRNRGRLPMRAYVRCRVRYFCDGAIFGSRGFVEEMFEVYRDRFGTKRTSGARRMRGLAQEDELFVLRDLQTHVFG
jgi:REP element-mobilizing transposase RayT